MIFRRLLWTYQVSVLPALVSAMLFFSGENVFANCTLSTPAAIMCSRPETALEAYAEFGDEVEQVQKDYNLARLRQALCWQVNSGDPSLITSVVQTYDLKIPTSSGWEHILNLTVNNKGGGWIDSQYLKGTCDPAGPVPAIIGQKDHK